jgi:hypothetical protein
LRKLFLFFPKKEMSIAQLVQDLETAQDNTWNASCKYENAKREEENQKQKLTDLLDSFSQFDLDEIHQWIDFVVEKSRFCWDGTRRFVFCGILPWIWNKTDSRGLHARKECLSASHIETVTPPEKMKQLFNRLHIDWVVEEYDSTRHKC